MLARGRWVTVLALVCAALPTGTLGQVPLARLAFLSGAESFSAPIEETDNRLLLPRAFHILGVPGVKRNRRVDLELNSRSLVVRHDGKERLVIPFERLRRLQVLKGKRTYAKATYAAVLGMGVGGLLVLNKNKRVDTLVFDFVNERGGEMGLILQVPDGKGADCIQWLRRFGITAEEPEPLSTLPVGGLPR
jgi:hypothetical protein